MLLVMAAFAACQDPPPPPNSNDGQFLLGIRTVLPQTPNPTLSGGQGETLDGLTNLSVKVSRIEVVHRTVADDASTEQVITVDNTEHDVDLLTDLQDTSPRLFAFLNIPPGFVLEIRFIVASASITLRSQTFSVKIPSGTETGVKVEPIDGVPFQIIPNDRTAGRIVLYPFAQLIRNHGQEQANGNGNGNGSGHGKGKGSGSGSGTGSGGAAPVAGGFMMKPVLEAEHVSLAELSPILQDRVVVGFKPGVDADAINAINAQIGTTILNAWPPTNYYVMHLPVSISLQDALAFYAGLPEVAYTLPDTLVFDRATPCNPGFSQGAGPFLAAHFPQAWDVTTGSLANTVAVIDGGFDARYPSLLPNWWLNRLELEQELLQLKPPNCGVPFIEDWDGDGIGGTFNDFLVYYKNQLPECPLLDLDGDGLLDPLDFVGPAGGAQGFQNGLPDDFGSQPDDLFGWNFAENSNVPFISRPDSDHGTKVAAIIGGRGALAGCTSADGIAGAAWRTSIMPIAAASVKLETFEGAGKTRSAFIIGINYAAFHRADVINVSAGVVVQQGPYTAAQQKNRDCAEGVVPNVGSKFEAFTQAARAEVQSLNLGGPGGGALLVVAAPNCPIALDSSPATFDIFADGRAAGQNIIVVGGVKTASPSIIEDFSAFGPGHVDIAAPADSFNFSTLDGLMQGNSFAAPLVSGTAALMLAHDPALGGHPDVLKARLLCNADRYPTLDGDVLDGNALNAFRAVVNAKNCP